MAGIYTVKAKKGLLVREGCALDTAEAGDIPFGTEVAVAEEQDLDGKARVRLTSPVAGWGSKRLLTFVCKPGKKPTGATTWLRKLAKPDKPKKRLVFFGWTGNRGGYGSSHNHKAWPAGLGDSWECWEGGGPA